jgi:uncharacterized protein with PIN domain
MAPVRFIADAMVGRLAVWLRLLGHDTAYEKDIKDQELIVRARRERRVILTRDRDVVARCRCPVLFIKSDQIRAQLRQVMRHFTLRRTLFSRCSLCNAPLEMALKSKIKGLVPPKAYAAYETFWRCPRCRKMYWRGSHASLFRKDITQKRVSTPNGTLSAHLAAKK